jgi:hypothetical protein
MKVSWDQLNLPAGMKADVMDLEQAGLEQRTRQLRRHRRPARRDRGADHASAMTPKKRDSG